MVKQRSWFAPISAKNIYFQRKKLANKQSKKFFILFEFYPFSSKKVQVFCKCLTKMIDCFALFGANHLPCKNLLISDYSKEYLGWIIRRSYHICSRTWIYTTRYTVMLYTDIQEGFYNIFHSLNRGNEC